MKSHSYLPELLVFLHADVDFEELTQVLKCAEFDLPLLHQLQPVSPLWQRAATQCIEEYTTIVKTFTLLQPSQREYRLLEHSAAHWAGHNHWMVKMATAMPLW